MNPLQIYQEALDVVSAAVLAGDFDRYAAMIDLPYLIHTTDAHHLITTTDDLRPTFETLSRGLAARGVTHYERVAREADQMHRDRISGLHFTHLIANGERIALPKVARQTIVRRGGNWLFSEAHYPIEAPTWPLDDATLFAPGGLLVAARGVG